MIEAVEMYRAVCDGCNNEIEYGEYGCVWDKETAYKWAQDDGWYFDNGKYSECYCPDCHSYNSENEVVIHPKEQGGKP